MLYYWLFRRIICNCRLFKRKYYLLFLRNERFRFHYLLLNIWSLYLNRRYFICLLLLNYGLFFHHNLYSRWLNHHRFFLSPFPPTTLYLLDVFKVRIETHFHFPRLFLILIIIRILLLPLLIITLLRVHVSLILELIMISPAPIIHSLCRRPCRCIGFNKVFLDLPHNILQSTQGLCFKCCISRLVLVDEHLIVILNIGRAMLASEDEVGVGIPGMVVVRGGGSLRRVFLLLAF